MQPDVDSLHELFVGVEVLGSQPDLHLDEEMVIAWCQARAVRRVIKNLPVEEHDESICVSHGVGSRVVVQENDAFSEHPALFLRGTSTSEPYSVFHSKPLMLLCSLVP